MPSHSNYLMKITKYLINFIKERESPGVNKADIEANIKPCIILFIKKIELIKNLLSI